MNSEIQVESKFGKGLQFWFELPVTEPKNGYENTEGPEVETQKEMLDDARILIVEDDDFSRMMLREMLDLWGISHDDAANGQEAVELAKKKQMPACSYRCAHAGDGWF